MTARFVNFEDIVFDVGTEWTISGDTSGLSGVISGFAGGDMIDLTGLHESVEDYAGSLLTLTGDASVTLDLPGSFSTASFETVTDAAGTGTNVFLACFAAGTQIETERGDVPVEALGVGERFRPVFSACLRTAIRIGHRHVHCRRHPQPAKIWPVRVSAHAFGPGRPRRDLYLSPDHAVFVSDVLIPVRHRVDGETIAQVPVDRVDYYHVEFEAHDMVLAEGLPVESYLEVGGRLNFANGGGPIGLHPDFAARQWEAKGCAPLVVTGPRVAAARRLMVMHGTQLRRRRHAGGGG